MENLRPIDISQVSRCDLREQPAPMLDWIALDKLRIDDRLMADLQPENRPCTGKILRPTDTTNLKRRAIRFGFIGPMTRRPAQKPTRFSTASRCRPITISGKHGSRHIGPNVAAEWLVPTAPRLLGSWVVIWKSRFQMAGRTSTQQKAKARSDVAVFKHLTFRSTRQRRCDPFVSAAPFEMGAA